MSARAPAAIRALWDRVDKAIPRAQLGGIVGDTAHSFGYHLARRDLSGSDYSVQLRADRLGASDCASALDVTLPADLMKICTKRLLVAAKARDPRLRALREFCGTLDGSHTYPWDLSTNTSEGVDTWDGSHLWHIHLSFYREYADNAAALAPIADVLAGVSLAAALVPAPTTRKRPDMFVYRVDMATAPKGTNEPGWHLFAGKGNVSHLRGEDGAVNNGDHVLKGIGQTTPITVSWQQHLDWKAGK